MKMRKVKKHHRRRSCVILYESSNLRTIHKPRKRMRTAIDYLLIDLVLEILHPLDLKFATRCKSASKKWCFVVTNPFFAQCLVNNW